MPLSIRLFIASASMALVIAVILCNHSSSGDAPTREQREAANRAFARIGAKQVESSEPLEWEFASATDSDLERIPNVPFEFGLILSGDKFSDDGLKHLSRHNRLTYVRIARRKLTEKGLRELARIPSLSRLELSGSGGITNAGAVAIGGIRTLTKLSLEDITDDGLDEIGRLANLKSLALDCTRISDKGLRHLPRLKKLSFLELSETGLLTDNCFESIAAIEGLTELHFDSDKITGAKIGKLSRLPNLAVLDLGHPLGIMKDEGLTDIATLKALRALSLDGTKVGFDKIPNVADLKLATLSLARCPVSNDGLSQISKIRQLKHLFLSFTKITEVGKEIEQLSNLEFLDLSFTNVAEGGLEHIVQLPNLRSLNLAGTKVSFSRIDVGGKLPKLVSLDLSDTPINLAGIKIVSELKRLEDLNLQGTRVGDDELEHLSSCCTLKYLDIRNTRVSDVGVANARRSMPRTKIIDK